MEVAMIGLHKRFCDELFFEKVYAHVSSCDFQADDIVLLITCNRIEIYLASPYLSERHPLLLEKLKAPFMENVEKRFYTFIGSDVLKHLAAVASGLDSLICGETDIQHQVKKAYQTMGHALNPDGHFLFQKALHISKKLRETFAIKPIRSLVDQVCQYVKPRLGELSHIVFVGHSELNEQIYHKLSTLTKLRATLISSTPPFKGSAFWGSAHLFYHQLESLEEVDGVILATKDRFINSPFLLKAHGWICDLSRPKVVTHIVDNYVDLHFFEEKSSKMALKQYAIKLEALEYIQQNVKRLLESRLLRFEKRLIL